jgi:flagellar operon protein
MDDQVRIRAALGDAQNIKPTNHSLKESGSSFQQYLDQASTVRFSNHAQKRLEARSIELDNEKINRLENAVEKANAHGSRDSLILLDELAFIVNVKERMVVTTMDMSQNKNGVFTQIDSVVIADGNRD